MKKIAALCFISALLAGCSVHHQFNDRLSYQSVKKIKSEVHLNSRPSLNITWIPTDFPSRVDIQGASGFIGGGSRTRIPTGIGISSRIEEAINTYADLNNDGRKLSITVNKAETNFTYGMSNIDSAYVYLNVTFDLAGKKWEKEFVTKQNDKGVKDAKVTLTIEYAWDQIALDVARNVAENL